MNSDDRNVCKGNVTFGCGRLFGTYRAICDECDYVSAYWDDDDIDPDTGEVDFSHEPFDKYANAKDGDAMSDNDRIVLAHGDEYRNLAADWHGGMSSALYAYASTGTILVGLQDEIDQCIAWCEANDDAGESDDCPDLYDMAGYVALAIVRHSIDGKGDE